MPHGRRTAECQRRRDAGLLFLQQFYFPASEKARLHGRRVHRKQGFPCAAAGLRSGRAAPEKRAGRSKAHGGRFEGCPGNGEPERRSGVSGKSIQSGAGAGSCAFGKAGGGSDDCKPSGGRIQRAGGKGSRASQKAQRAEKEDDRYAERNCTADR